MHLQMSFHFASQFKITERGNQNHDASPQTSSKVRKTKLGLEMEKYFFKKMFI